MALNWNQEWIAKVEEVEKQLNRRIGGAPSRSGLALFPRLDPLAEAFAEAFHGWGAVVGV